MSERPEWDDQFAETEEEREERQRTKRHLKYDKAKRTIVERDPRDPDYSREGIFILHNCWRCQNGAARCASGNPRQCEYPHARND